MKKFMLLILLTFIIFIIDSNVSADIEHNTGSDTQIPINSGSIYSVTKLGVRVVLVNKRDTVYSYNGITAEPVVYWYSQSQDDIVSQGDVKHNVNFRVAAGCVSEKGEVNSTDCSYSKYLAKISEYKDAELVKFFIKKSLKVDNLTANQLNDIYNNGYLKFEPYYELCYRSAEDKSNCDQNYTYAGTSRMIWYGSNGNNGVKKAIDSGKFADPKASIRNLINSIKITRNFQTNGVNETQFPVYSDSNCSQNKYGADKIFECYMDNSTNPATGNPSGWSSGLGVGYIRMRDIIQPPTCEGKFSSGMTMQERIKLYEQELASNPKNRYTNLLNFSIKDASTACKAAECNATQSSGCLSASFNTGINFGPQNLSCYTEVINDAYCLSTFKLENNIGNFGNVSSGQLVFNKQYGVIGNLNRVCYSYKDGNTGLTNIDPKRYVYSFNYDTSNSQISSILTQNADIESSSTPLSGSGYTGYNVNVKIKYQSPKVYSENISGKISYKENCKNCKFLGYGIVSKMNKTGNFTFNPKLVMGPQFSNSNVSMTCNYKANQRLIEDIPRLRFRIIDTSNPFPGPDGNGRDVNQNWCDLADCSNDNEVVINTIINANNSYNIKNKSPKYSIDLSPSDIQVIRAYNKKTTYSDYTLECSSDGKECKSKFLKGLTNGRLYFNDSLIGSISKLIIND